MTDGRDALRDELRETSETYHRMPPEQQKELFGFEIRGENFTVPVGRLRPNHWNPNEMSEQQFDALGKAIEKHGFIGDVLVRYQNDEGFIPEGEFEIIDGEHRHNQVLALANQNPEAPVRILAVDAPDWEAKLLTVAKNETVGSPDKVKLSVLIAGLIEGGLTDDEVGDVLPYGKGEIAEMVEIASHAWEGYGDDYHPDDDGAGSGDDGGAGGDFVTVEAAFTEEDFAAVESVRRRIADVQALSGDEPVRWGQVFHAMAAEYLAGNPDGGSGF